MTEELSADEFEVDLDSAKLRDDKTRNSILMKSFPPMLRDKSIVRAEHRQSLSPHDRLDEVDMVGVARRFAAQQRAARSEQQKSKMETIYSFLVEALSVADLITDILVVIQLVLERESILVEMTQSEML